MRPLIVTYESFKKSPEILTQFRATDKALKCFDGKVGSLLEDEVLVTSPNVSYLYAPPLNIRRVRLRKDGHFGADDPLYYPQPFSPSTPHLALIRVPSLDIQNEFYAAWMVPRDKDFVEEETSSTQKGLGKASRRFRALLRVLGQSILDKVNGSEQHDQFLVEGTGRLQLELTRLETPASLKVTLLRVGLIQRWILEIDARLRWLSNQWRHRFSGDRTRVHGVQDIIGAFVEKTQDADILYYAGVPVWLVRLFTNCPGARVDSVGDVIQEDHQQRVKLHCGYLLNCADEQPSNQVIYVGLANKSDRYTAMAEFMDAQFQTPSLFGLPETTKRVVRKIAFPVHEEKKSRGIEPWGLNRKSGRKSNPKDSYCDLASPLMPECVQTWEKALKRLENTVQIRQGEGKQCGFFVPPARCLISPGRVEIVATLFQSWVKIREMVLSKLACPDSPPIQLSNKFWRSLLDVHGGLHTSLVSTTRSGLRHLEMRKLLEKSYGISFSDRTLESRAVYWEGELIGSASYPEKSAAHRILWELCEVNFRNELEALDALLDRSRMPWMERDALRRQCWVGSAKDVKMSEANKGLAARSDEDRIHYLRSLQRVMRTWEGDKPAEVMDEIPEVIGAHNSSILMERFENGVAYFYCESFMKAYGRVPSVPHRL